MLKRLALTVMCLILATPALAGGGMRRLDTGDDSRGWEAVGRLEIRGQGFCTGALIAPDLVLTAAHCMYNPDTGQRYDATQIEFRAGWRNGRASAYRSVRQAVVHPEYSYAAEGGAMRVLNDLALLRLHHPIRNTTVAPFPTGGPMRDGSKVGVVSYAHDRAEAPALQNTCEVLGRQEGIYVMSCDVDYGSSGAPVFRIDNGRATIVSVVSAKADMNGKPVALGVGLDGPLELLRAGLDRVGNRSNLGAKFVKP